jgi:hypothetical protein
MELTEKIYVSVLDDILTMSDIPIESRIQLQSYKKKVKDCSVPVTYNYSKYLVNKGRLFVNNGVGLQSIKRKYRMMLTDGIYYDLDFVNCHPVILRQYCKKNNIQTEYLDVVVDMREEILELVQEHHNISRDVAKKLILRLTYGGGYKLKNEKGIYYEPTDKCDILVGYKEEIMEISCIIKDIEIEVYNVAKNIKYKKNKNASTLSMVINIIENELLMIMYEFLMREGYVVGVLCFDGMMVEKNKIMTEDVMKKCEEFIESKKNYRVKIEMK